MGHLFALMFLPVKFETLTYLAHETDYSVRASAPAILGRPTSSSELSDEAVSAPVSNAFLQLWMWMSLQLIECLAKYRPQKAISESTPSHIFIVPGKTPDAPRGAVRVNRSIMRKLRRLERLRPEAFQDKGEPLPDWVKALSPNQFLDYMIRARKWCRVKVHRLGGGTWNKLRRSAARLSVQGSSARQSKAAHCNAILTPD